jgi:4-hydroxy-tetrahydrodipicolinate synthase
MAKKLFFEGIVCPMITPLNPDFSLDQSATIRLLEHLIDGEIEGIFILGTTGEASSLSLKTKKELIYLCCQKLKATEIPLLVGIGDTAIEQSISLCNYAKEQGADAVVALPPYYFDLNTSEIQTYFTALANQCSLPLFLYNYPKSTHFNIPPNVILALQQHPNIIGCKDSSGNADYLEELTAIAKKKRLNFLIGPEELLTEWVLKGFHGGVNGGSNLFPKLFLQLSIALKQRDLEKVSALHQLVMRISKEIYALEGGAYSYLKGIKAAATAMGICKNVLAPPLLPGDESFLETIQLRTQSIQEELDTLI